MNRLLAAKIPLFRVSGIQVYAHSMFVLFAAWELWHNWDFPGWALLIIGTLWLSVLLHEFGHCAGARYQGGDATEILLWPLGGLALCDAPRTPWSQGFVAASGPAVNVVLFTAAWALGHALPEWHEGMYRVCGFAPRDVTNVVFATNLGLFTFNMMPAFPMDMGRIYQAVMWVWLGFQRSMRIAVYTTFVCAGAFLVYTLVQEFAPTAVTSAVGPSMQLLLVVWLVQEGLNELQRLNAGAYEDLDEPWRQTYRYHPEAEPSPGFIARWTARREEAKAKKDAEEQEARATRLDEVLRRVAQVGMDGLTPDEKTFLEAESARLRKKA